MLLTDEFVTQAKYTKTDNKADLYFDRKSHVVLRVYPSGRKSFFYSGKDADGKRMTKLGDWPDVQLMDAMMAALRLGREERSSVTFLSLCTDWLNSYAKPRRSSWKEDERRIKKHIGILANKCLDSINIKLLTAEHARIGESSGHVEANRWMGLCSSVLNWGRKQGIAKENPALLVDKFPEQSRTCFLAAEDCFRLAAYLRSHENRVAASALELLLYTGLRKSEVLSLEWRDVDLVLKTVFVRKPKNRKSRYAPLSDRAVEILQSLQGLDSQWVFPSRKRGEHLSDPKKTWAHVCDHLAIPALHIHDLRRTVGSLLAQDGASLLLIGQILGHQTESATRIYSRFDLANLRQALDSYSAKLDQAAAQASSPAPVMESLEQ